MHSKKKKIKLIRVPLNSNEITSNEKQYSSNIYNAKSFFIRYYAYLPFIYFLRKVNFYNNSHVLDIGCADGPFLPTLNHYSGKTIAIDINEELIKKSRDLIENKLCKLKKVNLLHSDGLALPLRADQFDLVFCLEVLEHVKNSMRVIEEIYRVLKTNGVLICSLPVEIGPSLIVRSLLGKFLKFKRPLYTKKELIQNVLLKKLGPRTESMSHKNFDWRLVKKEVKAVFGELTIEFIPIHILRDINPIVLIKTIKKS